MALIRQEMGDLMISLDSSQVSNKETESVLR